MFYLDASVLVGALTDEPGRQAIQRWMKANQTDLSISSWTLTEVASALSIKVRRQEITAVDQSCGLRQVELMRNTFLLHAPIDETHFFAATRFARSPEAGLRAGDALHVAIAADYGLSLVTLDKAQAKGADALGVETLLLA